MTIAATTAAPAKIGRLRVWIVNNGPVLGIFLAIFLLWGEFFRLAIGRATANPWVNVGFWLGRELVWWWVMGVMGALLLRFVLDSEIGRRFGFAVSQPSRMLSHT